VLSVIKLADAEYAIAQVAIGVEEYYLGEGEAPGVWAGRWAPSLGLEGVVGDQQLRSLVNGVDPRDGTFWLEGRPARKVNAFDGTFSAPKSVSLLWAFASPEVSAAVMHAHLQAVAEALAFLEERAALSRQQSGGVRARVGTEGWAVATFVHRTSRAGDPQVHTHCVVPNVARRADGSYATLDGAVLYEWAKAAGSVYQEQLRRTLTAELGVVWGRDRNGCREMVGFTPAQLRTFSKRTSQIEAYLERSGGVYQTAVHRMRADHAASLSTRPGKDRSLTPERLKDQWAQEAAAVGLASVEDVERAVCGRVWNAVAPSWQELVAALVHPETGLCASESRFGEAHVVERIAALGAATMTVPDIEACTTAFLASGHVVRLSAEAEQARRTAPRWTTAEHLALEQRVLSALGTLIAREVPGIGPSLVRDAIAADRLGADQADAVRVLCATGPALRSLVAPAGFGKTTSVHAAASAAASLGLPVVAVATTNKAVAELRDAGIPAMTIARLARDLAHGPLAPGTVVVLDEVSQVSTRDAEVVAAAVAEAPAARLWCLGDARQAQSVGAGGLAAELDALGTAGRVPVATLTENRRQRHPAERQALAAWRHGDLAASQAIRTEAGLEHEHGTPSETREAMADAVAADIVVHGAATVAALAVSHADCEDLADRVRDRLAATGTISGPALEGPAWGAEPRRYQAGDRVLLHARTGTRGAHLPNGTTVTVTAVSPAGLTVGAGAGAARVLPAEFVAGRRPDGRPNVSHAWCRTVDSSQGGTWEHVHLLGSHALDNFSAYVGQSRARAGTHTWNVRAIPAGDWGGRLVDQRSAAAQVIDAAAREPLKTFAARDDPMTPDRELRAEIAAHQQALAAGPPDVRTAIDETRQHLSALYTRAADLAKQLDNAEKQVAAGGPFEGLRRQGRERRAGWAAAAGRCRDELAHVEQQTVAAQRGLVALESADAAHRGWVKAERWRTERIAELRGELDHHWARTVLAAVRQGDPLAYGGDRLRRARATVAADLDRLEASVPPDITRDLADAQAHLASRRDAVANARQRERRATADLEAERRRWGPRRREIADAQARLRAAREDLDRWGGSYADAKSKLDEVRAAVEDRKRALAAVADRQATLRLDVDDLDHALDTSRRERVLAVADGREPGEHLRGFLGAPPPSGLERSVWCQLATRIESALEGREYSGALRRSRDSLDNLVADLVDGREFARMAARSFIDNATAHDVHVVIDADDGPALRHQEQVLDLGL
jgi:conjugative relaxase-like TrwC/TraI family protein